MNSPVSCLRDPIQNMTKSTKKKVPIVPKKPDHLKVVKIEKEVKELGRLAKALRLGGGAIGGAIGTLAGSSSVGATLGSGLGASLSRWLGSGDYEISRNSLVSRFESTGQIPAMHSNNLSITLRHKEYIYDIIAPGNTNFATNQPLPLNPGIALTFPWLSSIASQFQEYTIKGMVFEYRSTSGDSVASTNTALGTVMIATNYRATAPNFANKQMMLNSFFSSDGKPSEDFCHPIECNPADNPYKVQYIRTGTIPVGEDLKTYDLGETTVAVVGIPTTVVGAVLGELWASYEVELRKPIAFNDLGYSVSSAHFFNNGATTAHIFGTTFTPRYDNIGMSFLANGTQFAFPLGTEGTFLVYNGWTSATAASAATLAVTNCTVPFVWNGGANPFAFSVGAAGSLGASIIYIVTITNPILQATITPTINLTGATPCEFLVTEINPLMT